MYTCSPKELRGMYVDCLFICTHDLTLLRVLLHLYSPRTYLLAYCSIVVLYRIIYRRRARCVVAVCQPLLKLYLIWFEINCWCTILDAIPIYSPSRIRCATTDSVPSVTSHDRNLPKITIMLYALQCRSHHHSESDLLEGPAWRGPEWLPMT